MTALAGSVATAILTGLVGPVLVTGSAVAASHLAAVPDPDGRVRSIGLAVVTGAGLLDVEVVVLVASLGWGVPVGWLLARIVRGERTGDDAAAGTFAGGMAFVAVFAVVHGLVAHGAGPIAGGHLVAAAAGGVAWLAGEAAAVAWGEGRRWGARPIAVARRHLNGWPVHLALMSIGGLFGTTWDVLGWPTVVLAGLPYGFVRLSLARLDRARVTLGSTIRVLGRIPEAGGYAPEGRADRVASVARAVSTEMGLRPSRSTVVDRAARLHAVGGVVLSDPAVAAAGYSERDLAQWGAAIVGEAEALGSVAHAIARHLDPYRRPEQAHDADVPLEARILRVSRFYTEAVDEGASPEAALDALHRGMAYDHDPEVVAALRRHLTRRGRVATEPDGTSGDPDRSAAS